MLVFYQFLEVLNTFIFEQYILILTGKFVEKLFFNTKSTIFKI